MWKLNYHVIIYHHQLTGNLVLDFVSFVSITCNLFFVSLRRNWLSQKFDNANCSYRQPFKETNFLLRKNYNSKTLYLLTICHFNRLQCICKKIYHLVLLWDHFKFDVHLVQEYIGNYHFPHFEADNHYKKYSTIAFFLKILYMMSNIIFTLYVKYTKFYRLVISGDHLKI